MWIVQSKKVKFASQRLQHHNNDCYAWPQVHLHTYKGGIFSHDCNKDASKSALLSFVVPYSSSRKVYDSLSSYQCNPPSSKSLAGPGTSQGLPQCFTTWQSTGQTLYSSILSFTVLYTALHSVKVYTLLFSSLYCTVVFFMPHSFTTWFIATWKGDQGAREEKGRASLFMFQSLPLKNWKQTITKKCTVIQKFHFICLILAERVRTQFVIMLGEE